MYFIYLTILLVSVYLAPALAFFPKLIYKPHTVIAIPVLSSLLVVIIVSILVPFHLFNQLIVQGLTGGLILLALFRVGKLLRSHPPSITFNATYRLWFFNFLLMLPFFVKLGTHSFDQGDEIYSWNYWAIQHYLQLPPDFTHTGAPYPQFLPKLLAYQYQLVGNLDYQLPIKALLGLFSLTLLNTFAMANKPLDHAKTLKYSLLILGLVFGVGLQHFFNDGYADPIMGASLTLSVYYAWLACRLKNSQSSFWLLSVATGVVAAYAKQPGLLWLGLILPLSYLLFQGSSLRQNKLKTFAFILCSTGLSLLWMFTEGKQFQQNGGVIGASLQSRSLSEHLLYLFNHYFVQQPFLAVFLILSFIGFWKYSLIKNQKNNLNQHTSRKFIKIVLIFLVLPYLALWFTFGAYQLRLGQHVIAIMGLFIILSGYRGLFLFNKIATLFFKKITFDTRHTRYTRIVYVGMTGVSVLVSVFLGFKQEYGVMQGIPWQNAGQRTLQVYFSEEGDKIYQALYQKPDKILWVPTRYLYGIFYGHTPVVMPSRGAILKNIIEEKADYVVTASKEITSAVWVDELNEAIKYCPEAFNKISTYPNKYGLVAYQIESVSLNKCFNPKFFNLG